MLKCQKGKLSLKAVLSGTLHFSPTHNPARPKLPISACTSTGKCTTMCSTFSPALADTVPALSVFLQPPWPRSGSSPHQGTAGGGGQVQPSLAEGGEACGAKATPVPQASQSGAFPTHCHGLSCPACPGCYMLRQQWSCSI